MGFWSKAAGIGLGIVGAVVPGAQFLEPIAGAIMGNEAQKGATDKAVGQQQAATDKAQGAIDKTYGQTRSDLNPYLQGGGAAFSSLGQMVGLPPTAGSGALPVGTGGPQTIGALMAPQGQQAAPQAQARAPQAAQAQTGSSYVTMRSPDGSTGQVPADHVAHYTQMGAKVV